MGSPSPASARIILKAVTSEDDIPILARLSDLALKPDAFHTFRERYGTKSIYDDTVEKITKALHDDKGQFFLFKAVLRSSAADSADEKETIVGFSQWRIGYVETPKMDPFAPKREPDESSTFEAGVSNVAVAEARETGQAAGVDADSTRSSKPFYSNPDAELSRKMGNAYIETIRGKKHVCLHRLIVHPDYQRQGIGQMLINWGIETADWMNLVAFLFSRPAGSRLYEKNGWKAVRTLGVEIPDKNLKMAPGLAMLRLPGAQRG